MTPDVEPPEALRAAADLADELLGELHHPPIPTSPFADDLIGVKGLYADGSDDVGQSMIHSVVVHSGRYLAYVSRGVRELATMIDAGAGVSLTPVVRSHVEYAARSWWLVEPLGQQPAAAQQRAIRLNLDLYTSVCYQRFTLNAARSPDASRARKARIEERDRICLRYSAQPSALTWAGPGAESGFEVSGVKYEALTAVTKRFLDSIPSAAGSPSSAYDALSGYSHPSPLFLQEMLTWVQLPTQTHYHWDVDSKFVAKLASYSEAVCWHAAASLARYVDRWEEVAE